MSKTLTVMVMSLICLALAAGSSVAQTGKGAADFYKGKTVQVIIGENPGGNTDLTGRTIAKHLQKQLGATLVVVNKSGAAHIEAYNYIWSAKPDALTLGCEDFSSLTLNDLSDEPGIHYQAEKYTFIGSVGDEAMICYVKAGGPIKTVQDLQAMKGAKFGSTSPAGGRTMNCAMTASILDIPDAKVITGFPGDKPVLLAIQQGEAVASFTTVGFYLQSAASGLVKALFAFDTRRSPGIPDLPAITELVKIPKEKMELLELFMNDRPSWIIYGPPGLPADRTALLRQAFDEMVKQNDFRADILKIWYPNVPFLQGQTLAERARVLKANKKKFQEALRVLFDKYRPL